MKYKGFRYLCWGDFLKDLMVISAYKSKEEIAVDIAYFRAAWDRGEI